VKTRVELQQKYEKLEENQRKLEKNVAEIKVLLQGRGSEFEKRLKGFIEAEFNIKFENS
jgi:SMC interacting uncharacterized protein involved in chromosome segregation